MSVHADNEIEGEIQAIDPVTRTLAVQGITLHTHRDRDYDDLNRFEDLRVDQKVEVDFVYRGGRHIFTEIELEDCRSWNDDSG